MDWKVVEEVLYELERYYSKSRYRHSIVMALIISPLLKRYKSGERTKELYNDIMQLK